MTLESIEFLIISAALSFDIFGEIAAEGALLPKINWKRLVGICIVMAVWQTVALFIGRFFGDLLYAIDTRPNADRAGRIIAAAIFIVLGIRAWKNEQVEEHRIETIPYSVVLKLLAKTTLYTMLTGFAVGFLYKDLSFIFPTIAIFTALAVTIGIYIGYHFGAAFKRGTCIASGIAYFLISVDIIVRYVLG